MKRIPLLLLLGAALSLPALAAPPRWLNGRVVDQGGMTLYFFSMDGPDVPNCNDACSNTWPPALAAAGDVAAANDLTLVRRGDGQVQWSFRGHPLYRYSTDQQPGSTAGDGVDGKWHEVTSFWP